jgi:hypothetical protein
MPVNQDLAQRLDPGNTLIDVALILLDNLKGTQTNQTALTGASNSLEEARLALTVAGSRNDADLGKIEAMESLLQTESSIIEELLRGNASKEEKQEMRRLLDREIRNVNSRASFVSVARRDDLETLNKELPPTKPRKQEKPKTESTYRAPRCTNTIPCKWIIDMLGAINSYRASGDILFEDQSREIGTGYLGQIGYLGNRIHFTILAESTGKQDIGDDAFSEVPFAELERRFATVLFDIGIDPEHVVSIRFLGKRLKEDLILTDFFEESVQNESSLLGVGLGLGVLSADRLSGFRFILGGMYGTAELTEEGSFAGAKVLREQDMGVLSAELWGSVRLNIPLAALFSLTYEKRSFEDEDALASLPAQALLSELDTTWTLRAGLRIPLW